MGELCEFEIDFEQFDDLRAVVVHDECGAHEDVWFYRFDGLKAENAKLRELVQKMMRFFEDGDWCTICECAKECDEQEQYEDDCLMRGVFHGRMRELGIEVNG